jgi:hypothetical protein
MAHGGLSAEALVSDGMEDLVCPANHLMAGQLPSLPMAAQDFAHLCVGVDFFVMFDQGSYQATF